MARATPASQATEHGRLLFMTENTGDAVYAERRRFPRIATHLQVKLQMAGDEQVQCSVLDASVRGVLLKGETGLAVGTDVTLIMPGSVHFGGRVIWREADRLGIEFLHAPERVAEMISDLLPDLKSDGSMSAAS